MPFPTMPFRFDRAACWVIASLLFLVPLIHSGALADPFALPKWTLILVGGLLLAGLAFLSHLFEESPGGLRSVTLTTGMVFVAAAALSVLPAANRGLALNGLAQIASAAVIFWGVTRFVKDARQAALLFRAVLLSATLVAVGSLAQIFLSGYDLSLAGFSILPPSRAGATLGDAGMAAQFLLLAFPIGIGAAALSAGWWRVLCGGGVGLVSAALLFVGRPEAWIVAAATLLLMIFLRTLRPAMGGGRWSDLAPDFAGDSLRSLLVALVVFVAVVSLSRAASILPLGRPVPPLQGISLLSPTTGNPVQDRAAAFIGSLALLRRHPLGVGPGNWRHAFLEVAWTTNAKSPFSLAHQAVHAGNGFLEMGTETGVLGGLIFALFMLGVLAQSGYAAALAPAAGGTLGFVAASALGAGCLSGFFGSVFHEPAPALMVWVMAGLANVALRNAAPASGALRRLAPNEPLPVPARVRRAGVVWATAGAWLVIAFGCGAWAIDRLEASHQIAAGQAQFYGGNYRAALEAFGQPAARRSPEYLPRVQSGYCYLRLGSHDKAADEFSAALQRSPFFISAYLGRAAAHKETGRYDLAEEDLKKALAIWPDSTDTLLLMASLDTTRGRLDAALADYERVTRLTNALAEPYLHMGDIYARRREYDDAIQAYRACAAKNPRYPGLQLRMGNAFYEKGMHEMALRYYQAAAANDEKDTEPLLKIANTNNALGKYCEATEALEAARDLETNPAHRAAILDLIATIKPKCSKQMKDSAPPGG